jgi:hypothetical protein
MKYKVFSCASDLRFAAISLSLKCSSKKITLSGAFIEQGIHKKNLIAKAWCSYVMKQALSEKEVFILRFMFPNTQFTKIEEDK